MGHRVILLCRSADRGQEALCDIRQQSSNPNVELMLGDLASQASIRRIAEEFFSRHD
jgi:hypothetical protein